MDCDVTYARTRIHIASRISILSGMKATIPGTQGSSLTYLMEVVRVECGLEGDDGKDEGCKHGAHMQKLQLLLSLTAKQAINQSPWN
jgi:hypothetical protein